MHKTRLEKYLIILYSRVKETSVITKRTIRYWRHFLLGSGLIW